MSLSHFSMALAQAMVLWSLAHAGPESSISLGRYSTVSESEWNTTLVIQAQHKAQIIEESWNAGEYNAREVTETAATWSVLDGVLIVSYDGVEDRLEFTEALSLAELGMQGAAPGLRQLEPIDERSRLGGYSMWLEPLKAAAATEPASAGKANAPEGLVFTIKPEKDEVTEDGPVVIQWELENKGSSPVYVCQWPGAAFGFGWDLGEGKSKGVGPGYPSSRKLDRKFFLELKPGEALLGSSVVNVFGTDAGEVWIRGEFRSVQTGQEYGLRAWRGRVYSESVRVKVPTRSTEQK